MWTRPRRRWRRSRGRRAFDPDFGGKDKNSDYTELSDLLRARCKVVYTIGSAAEKIERHLAGVVKIVSAGTLDVAVRMAAEDAVAGDVVLLAPACSSFDQFENYEQRGRVFKEIGEELGEWSEREANTGSFTSFRMTASIRSERDGEAGWGRQMDVRDRAAAGAVRAGDGVLGVGGDGEGDAGVAV